MNAGIKGWSFGIPAGSRGFALRAFYFFKAGEYRVSKRIPDKPFKSYDEQIIRLREEYGLVISNLDFAKRVLSSISYYDLVNGYQECMMANGEFHKNISIEALYFFHIFDKRFQGILFQPTLFIENSFKTKLAYLLGQQFGVFEDEYLNETRYHAVKNNLCFSQLKSNILRHLGRQPNDATKHYRQHHNHLPPWIALKNLSFADALNLFILLKDSRLKGVIVDEMLPASPRFDFSLRLNFLLRSLHLIREVRNQIAHNLKFISFHSRVNKVPSDILRFFAPYGFLTKREVERSNGMNNVYAMILATSIYLDKFMKHRFIGNIGNYMKMPQVPQYIVDFVIPKYCVMTGIPKDMTSRAHAFLKAEPL
ncbi:MAG: Abi family protein [Pyramidobacter porci]|uniref:Abi family protein n=1 Tax=Pyramidobacter porci TaxID=2605789 RepID=UPI002A759A57|nr:Abi family protein [Pyramidobacter porci]MDY2649100.1 Abi family protein [Pyramidobacter porci]